MSRRSWLRHPPDDPDRWRNGRWPPCPHGIPFSSHSMALNEQARLGSHHAPSGDPFRCATPGCGWHLSPKPSPPENIPPGTGQMTAPPACEPAWTYKSSKRPLHTITPAEDYL